MALVWPASASDSLPGMRIGVLGAGGMLGQALVGEFGRRGHDVDGWRHADADVTSAEHCARVVANIDVVVNAAAFTRVDDAETHEAEAFIVNAVGPALLARACAQSATRLVQLSTDYVFDGAASAPYSEDAPMRPRSGYGRTKAAGEWAVRAELPMAYIVRTAWLYGPGGGSFPATMLRLARERETLAVVDDQRGQPTTTRDVARYVADLVDRDASPGTYHATSEGETTWYGFARALFADAGLDPDRLVPTDTASFPRPAPRPAYSVLGHARSVAAGLDLLPPWRKALSETLNDLVGRRA
jgi:dTDP-4-dehydrorhamnose reductase